MNDDEPALQSLFVEAHHMPPPKSISPEAQAFLSAAATLKASANAPNILLVLTDDVGFGAAGTFGGLVSTPNLDRVAANGLRYNRFHTTAMCSPTTLSAGSTTKRPRHRTNRFSCSTRPARPMRRRPPRDRARANSAKQPRWSGLRASPHKCLGTSALTAGWSRTNHWALAVS